MKRLTREWIDNAEVCFHAANKLGKVRLPLHSQVCFHCQQSAENYLKALMQELGLTALRTDNLLSLLSHLLPYHASLRRLRRGLDFLTRFTIETTYPGKNASKREAASALRWADRVRAAARPLLGIRARWKTRKRSP